MFKANEIYLRNVMDVLKSTDNTLGEKVRPKYKDGTPSHTQFITNIVDTYDISKGEFPITNFRPVAWKSCIKEILWMWQDQSNNLDVLENKYDVHWWNSWDIGDRTVGLRYGAILKKYDLVNKLIRELKETPYSRRHVINMLQYSDYAATPGLQSCVYETIWNTRGDYLDLIVMQRSSDYIVSETLDRLQYCALMMMVAHSVGKKPGKYTYVVANLHIYDRNIGQAKLLVRRKPIDLQPKLIFEPKSDNFYEYTIDDFRLEDFECPYKNLKFEKAI